MFPRPEGTSSRAFLDLSGPGRKASSTKPLHTEVARAAHPLMLRRAKIPNKSGEDGQRQQRENRMNVQEPNIRGIQLGSKEFTGQQTAWQ